FEGVTDEATFCVADLHGVSGVPDDSLVVRFGQERFAISFPLGPGGHVRLIWLHGTAHPEQDEALLAVTEEFALTYEHLGWFSAYRVHHRVATHFRRGRVLLAGDAARVHSPVGGQGMNTGLQDAHHLACLLADVLAGRLAPTALERYEQERRPVALTLIRATDRAFGVIARPGRGTAFVRRRARPVIGALAPRLLASRLGPYLAGLLGPYRIRHHAVPGGEPSPPAGRRRGPARAAGRAERRGAAVAGLAAAQLRERGRPPRLRPRVGRGTVPMPARPAGPAARGPALPGAARRVCRGVLPRPGRRCG